MSFGEWLQRRRANRLSITVPFFTVSYVVGAAVFQVFPFGKSDFWTTRFFAGALFWGSGMGAVFALLPRPGIRKKKI
jgi:hypothetical protein